MANAGAKLSSFPEVNDIQAGDMFPLLSDGNTNAKIDYATLARAIIAKEVERATAAENKLESEKADKTLATASANGLMSAADKKAIDREFFRLLPKGGIHIPPNADLNTIEYIKIGSYYNSATNESMTIKNIPVGSAFIMYVLAPLSEFYDNESTDQWVYRLRIFITYDGRIFTQYVGSGATAGDFSYGPWVKMTNSNDLGAVSKIINDHAANKSNPHAVTKAQVGLGSVANIDQSKAIKSITRSGTTFTATALDGTTTTFTQQDSTTTYGIATSSTDGLMSAADKTKLDGVADQASQLAKNTAQIETAGTATNAHSAGEYVMISNALYKVTAAVAKGDTWTIGTNVTAANIGSEIGSLKSDLANKLYPVGSIYLSVNDTDPAELFGGTWERIKDKFLLASGDTYSAGSTGGEAEHTLSAAEMPSHAHTVRIWDPQGTTGDAQGASAATYGATLITVPNGATTSLTWNNSTPQAAMNGIGDPAGVTEFSGGGKQHNNMPPYLAVYMWKRTA